MNAMVQSQKQAAMNGAQKTGSTPAAGSALSRHIPGTGVQKNPATFNNYARQGQPRQAADTQNKAVEAAMRSYGS